MWFYYLILVKGMALYLMTSVHSAHGSNTALFQILTSLPSTVPYLATPFTKTKTSKSITEPFRSGRLQSCHSVTCARVRLDIPVDCHSAIQSKLLVLWSSEKSIDYLVLSFS